MFVLVSRTTNQLGIVDLKGLCIMKKLRKVTEEDLGFLEALGTAFVAIIVAIITGVMWNKQRHGKP